MRSSFGLIFSFLHTFSKKTGKMGSSLLLTHVNILLQLIDLTIDFLFVNHVSFETYLSHSGSIHDNMMPDTGIRILR